MSSETLVPEMDGSVVEGIVGLDVVEEGPGPMVRALDINPCYTYAESVNPMFDPGGLTSSHLFHQRGLLQIPICWLLHRP